jgi:hypothetical protein
MKNVLARKAKAVDLPDYVDICMKIWGGKDFQTHLTKAVIIQMKNARPYLIILSVLLMINSCSDKVEKWHCMDREIIIENNCGQNIMVEYFELDGDDNFNFIPFDRDGCDISEQSIVLPSGSKAEIRVYIGSCVESGLADPDSCDNFFSVETILVQNSGKEIEVPVEGKFHIRIYESNFN